jgi:hypothetical protein
MLMEIPAGKQAGAITAPLAFACRSAKNVDDEAKKFRRV